MVEARISMNRTTRMILLFLGLLIMACSLAALAFAVWPFESTSVQATLAPTFFAPPR
jgi:hypothetical protein